jgi:hypothetical protein
MNICSTSSNFNVKILYAIYNNRLLLTNAAANNLGKEDEKAQAMNRRTCAGHSYQFYGTKKNMAKRNKKG